MNPEQSACAILLCDDLMFSSRITGTARSLAINMRTARTIADLLAILPEAKPKLIILDLANPGLDLAKLFAALTERAGDAPFVVAYGSHVDAAGLQAAREAGCNLVLPRSKFVDELPNKLTSWLNQRA